MKNLKYLLMFAAVCALSSCAKEYQPQDESNQSPEVAYNGGEVEKGWVRIKLQESAQALKVGSFTRGAAESGNAELDKIAQELGATEIYRVFEDGGKFAERRRKYGLHLWYDVKFDEEVPVTRAMTQFKSMKGVQIIEPIYRAYLVDGGAMSIPAEMVYTPSAAAAITRPSEMPFNDPQLKDQWHYNNNGSAGGMIGSDINLFAAWKVETGKPTVIVSVHDEGVDVSHEDLSANMWKNPGEIPGNGIDDDKNGFTDDVYGWNYVNSSPNINKDKHGTHVSGTIAAVNNNGTGVGGVAGGDGTPNSGVRIMSCNVIRNQGAIVPSAPDSYAYAADNGAVISQNSWTLGSTGGLSASYEDAFQYFIDNAGIDENGVQTGPMKGGIIIFASANTGGPTFMPAASEKVIAVAATGPNYDLTSYANRGPEIDIVAPGGQNTGPMQVLSLDVNNNYTILWGTSMACPHVSGVAALIVSKFGKQGFTAAECKKRLLNGYRPLGGYISEANLGNVGVGLCDAAIALMEDAKTAPGTVESASVTAKENILSFSWTVPADGNALPVKQFIVEYTGVTPDASRVAESATFENRFDIGKTVKYTLKAQYNKVYDIKVYAVDRYGNKSAAVSLKTTTNNFVNKAPVQKKSIPNTEFAASGTNNKVSYSMIDYVYDANTSQGDILTYTIESSVTGVVKAEMEGSTLVLTPLAKGTSKMTVTATDLAGENVRLTFSVTVLSGSNVQVGGSINVMPNPVDGELNFVLSEIRSATVDVIVYDSAARKVASAKVAVDDAGKGILSVSNLASGVYTIVVKSEGAQIKNTFVKR